MTRLSDAQSYFANGERNQMNEANFTVGKRIIVHGDPQRCGYNRGTGSLATCVVHISGGGPITVVSRARLSGERRRGNFPALRLVSETTAADVPGGPIFRRGSSTA